jgi:hypothetical protein
VIDFGLAAIGGVLYFLGLYNFALLLIALAIVSGAGAIVKSIANPDWYAQQRMQAGLDVDFINPGRGIASLIATKVLVITILLWAAWRIATKAGYL